MMEGNQQINGHRTALAWLCAMALSLGACLPQGALDDEEEFVAEEADVTKVLAVMVTVKEAPLVHRTNGEIVPSNTIQLNAVADGTIETVLVREGQRITAATQVIRFDNAMVAAKLEYVQAEIEAAEAAIDYEQYRLTNRDTLLDEEEISSTVFDLIEKSLAYEQGRLKRGQAEVEYLRRVAENSEVVSPIGGVVTNQRVEDGMPVTEGQFLMEVVQDDPVKLKVSLPQEFISATYRGQLLQVKFPDDEEESTVKITELGLTVDSLTKTFDAFVQLDNPEGQLKAGMSFPVRLTTDKKTKSLTIPKSAVALRDKKTVVFQIEEGRAKQTRVRLGRVNGDEVAVQRGVEEGVIIVLDPPAELRHDMPVEILTTAAAGTVQP